MCSVHKDKLLDEAFFFFHCKGSNEVKSDVKLFEKPCTVNDERAYVMTADDDVSVAEWSPFFNKVFKDEILL